MSKLFGRSWLLKLFMPLVGACLGVLPFVVNADDETSAYPKRTVTIVVPVAPGGVTDVNARLLAELLSKSLGQSFVVENRAGASGAIGASAVSRAAPNGYTLLFQYNAFHLISPQINTATPWNPLRDFVPIANVSSNPQVIVVKTALPVTNFQELIAYGKSNPKKLTYGTAGIGSMHHVTTELLQQITGAQYTHVPFAGSGPVVTNLLGGVVDFALPVPSSVIPHVQSGKLRALAVTGNERLRAIPDVPTTVELGFAGLVAYATSAMYAPVGTPEPIIKKLTKAIEEASRDEAYIKKLDALGVAARYMSPSELGKSDAAEYERWGRVVKSANIQP